MKCLHVLIRAAAFAGLLLSATAQTPAVAQGIKAFRDLAYVPHGHNHQKLDLYLPENAQTPTPLVVWIHGGGWVDGDKAGCPPLTSGFLQRGYAAASLNYRVSGDALFPAQIEDCKAAIRWLRAHAKEYNLDPSRIGVWGASAGGHLVALLGTTGQTREFDVGENLDQSSAVQAVCDFFGPTDLLQMDAHAVPNAHLIHNSPQSPESRLVGGPIQQEPYKSLARRVNPILYLKPGAPPYLIVHGDHDPLVPHHQSELLFAALQSARVPVHFHTIEGAGHGVGFGGQDIHDMVAAFFDYRLLGVKTAAAAWPDAMTSHSAAVFEPGRSQADVNPSGPSRPPLTWKMVAAREDANHDGKVTRDEFKGPPPLFDRLDTNHDGVLTESDFQESTAVRPTDALTWQVAHAASADKTDIAALWTQPKGQGPFPVLVYTHGAPGGVGEAGLRDVARQSRWKAYVDAGFAICLTDYRGHPQDRPFDVLKGEVTAADDLAAVFALLGHQPKFDSSRIALMGGSLGGASALLGATEGKIAPRCLILVAPASFIYIGVKGRPDHPGAHLTDADFDHPATLSQVEKISCPVLIIQGTADGLAPLNQTLFEVMKEAGKDASIELFEGQGHSFTNGPDNEAYRHAVDVTLAFLRRYDGLKAR